MKRVTKVNASGLNIKSLTVTEEEATATYERLMTDVFNLRRPIKIFGEREGIMISFGKVITGEMVGQYMGNMVTYVDIRPDESWFNTQRLEIATSEDLRRVSIPADLKAKARVIPFFFDSSTHTLVFETYHRGSLIGATQMQDYFEELFLTPSIVEKYGTIEVVLIKSSKMLETILAQPTILKLDIYFTPPNPLRERMRIVRRNLENQNIDGVRIQYSNRKEQSIKPGEETMAYLHIAEEDGHVDAEVKDANNKRAKMSTEKKPEVKTETYEPESDHISALSKLTRAFIRRRRDG
jgi:hypothetical protein